jgi:lysophospholipase L1-like esterase
VETGSKVNTALESEIDTFTHEDQSLAIREPIVFYGSSTFRRWTNMSDDLKDNRILNRGFGGAAMADLLFYAGRVPSLRIAPQVFLYGGGNDISQRRGSEEIIGDFYELLSIVRRIGVMQNCVIVSILPHPRFRKRFAQIEEVNYGLSQLAQIEGSCFCDVYSLFSEPVERDWSSRFCEDAIHLNEHGYSLLAEALRPLLIPFSY